MWHAEFLAVKRFIDDMHIQPQSGKVIEIGGGPYVVVEEKVQPNPTLTVSPQVIFLDAGFISRYGDDPHIKADFLNWSAIQNLASNFDLVYSFQTIDHVINPFIFARHLVAIAKPGGIVFVTSVFSYPYHPSPADYWRFSPDGMRELFRQAGNNVVLWSGFGPNTGGVIAVVQRMPASYAPYPHKLHYRELFNETITV